MVISMKLGLIALVLALGTPLPYVEALEEDAIVEVTKVERRASRLERQKARVLPAPVLTPPAPSPIPVTPRPPSDPDISSLFSRPPPAN